MARSPGNRVGMRSRKTGTCSSMFKIVSIAVFLLAADSAKDEAAIRRTFDSYRDALAESDGPGAYRWVDSQTRDYYADILDQKQGSFL